MVKHKVFGVERDIDIPKDAFPSDAEIETMESFLPECEHGWFDSVHEGLKLHYRRFVPPSDGKPLKGIVVWMHGIQTHSGRGFVFDDDKHGKRKINMSLTANACLEQGLALYAYDMVGHGYSEGTRFHIPSFEVARDDYMQFIKLVASFHGQQQQETKEEKEKQEVIPTFLMGESFGANMSMQVAKHYQLHPTEAPVGFDSVIMLSLGLYEPPHSEHVLFGLKYIATPIGGTWRLPDSAPNPVTPDVIWREPEIVALYAKEKRVTEMLFEPGYRHCKFGTLQTLWTSIVHAKKHVIPGFRVPYCAVHGTEDRAMIIEECLDYLLEHTSTPEKDLKYLRIIGGYHDLLADPDSEKVVAFVMDWIQQRSTGATKWIDRDFSAGEKEEENNNTADAKKAPQDVFRGSSDKGAFALILTLWLIFIYFVVGFFSMCKTLSYGKLEHYSVLPIMVVAFTTAIMQKKIKWLYVIYLTTGFFYICKTLGRDGNLDLHNLLPYSVVVLTTAVMRKDS